MGRHGIEQLNFTNGTSTPSFSAGRSNSSLKAPKLIFVPSNKPSLLNYTLTTGTLASIYNNSRISGVGNYLQSAEQSNRPDLWMGSSLSRRPQSSEDK